MGNCTRKQAQAAQLLLAFKVLHFVNQLRRRVKTRVQSGFDDDSQLGSHLKADRTALRRTSGLSRLGAREAQQPQRITNRISKGRKVFQKSSRPVLKLHTSVAVPSVCPNESGEAVQHQLSNTEAALTTIASDNKLFLKHGNSPILQRCSLHEITWLLLSTFSALQTLSECRSQFSDDCLAEQGQRIGLNIDETFVANLEHLLLWLQAKLEQTLMRKARDELLHPMGGYGKNQRQLLACLDELAEKARPLSISFPWTIKPSLAVLWGVCWMFYDRAHNAPTGPESGNDRVPVNRMLQRVDVPWTAPGSSEYLNFGLEMIGLQPQPEVQQQTGDNMPVGPESNEFEAARNADTWQPDWYHLESRHPSLTNSNASPIGSGSTAPFPGINYRAAPQQYPIYPDNNYLPKSPGATSVTAFTLSSNLGQSSWHHQLPYSSSPLPPQSPRHLINPPQTPSIRVTGTAGTGSEVFAPPQPDFAAWPDYIFNASGPPHNQHQNFYLSTMGNTLPPVNPGSIVQLPQIHLKHERAHSGSSIADMPTPVSMAGNGLPSPVIEQQRTMMSSPRTHARQLSDDISSDEHDGSLRKNHSYKRAEEPPRNSEAKMICKHSECSGITFDRKCEWSKHMDKHDRPYKCLVKGCEKLQGFTYSGGLLRHEREVHKMHGGTKKSLFCPFTDCKRSSGAGFTRKENLAEHIRRVHRRTSMSADMHGLVIRRDTIERSPTVESRQASESPYVRNIEYHDSEEPALKRKRISDSVLSDRADEDLRAEIKRLRRENDEKDSRLRQLEQAVMALQQSRR